MVNQSEIQEKAPEGKSDAWKRIITSAVYVAVLCGLIAAKWLIDDGYGAIFFDAVFCAIAVLGSLEIVRALGCISVLQKAATITFSALTVPMYVLMEMLTDNGVFGLVDTLVVGAIVICVLFVTDHAQSTLKSTLGALFTLMYAGLLTGLLSVINHIETNSMLAVIVLFVSVMLTDAFAYIFGVAFARYVPLKLAPQLSPKKTIIGAVGGLIGGIGGAVAAYYIFLALGGACELSVYIPEVLAMIFIGAAVSVAAQFGDLFESALKRECNIKDMGKILPGHGGVMDRFDGTLFAGMIVLIAFMLMA